MLRAILTNKWSLLVLLFLLHLYVFQAVRNITRSNSHTSKIAIFVLYWAIFAIQAYCVFRFSQSTELTTYYLFTVIVIIFIAQLSASIFLLLDDIRRMLLLAKRALASSSGPTSNNISRSTFLSWIALLIGGFSGGTFIYGMSNRYNYKLRKINMKFPNLPSSFRDLKIIQISDIHSGSFNNPKAVMRGVQMILDARPDLILFTGDLVNNRATEMNDYKAIFSKLKAPMGVYSTLGNHDYGDYVEWPSAQAKKENLEHLKKLQAEMGWKLLMNENVIFDRNGEKIALLGIENWGAKGHFPKYGRLDLAHRGTEDIPFKILMSHDPSHWDAQVRPEYPDIDLTLSGHTHGMQFGIEIPGFKWSPIKWMYKEWEDLYQEKKQFVYVNRGFGFLGYLGRVGILPEITLIQLT